MQHQLQQWLSDRERQRETQRAIDGFAQRWNGGVVQSRFDAAMAELSDDSAESVAAAARALLADDLWLDTLIGGLAERMRQDPFFEPPFRALNGDVHSGLIVFSDPRLSIGAGVVDVTQLAARKLSGRSAASVGFSGRIQVLRFVKAGGARLSLWEAPAITASFAAAGAGQCRCVGERELADGDIITIDGRRQSYVIERAAADLLVVQAEVISDEAPLRVEYDSASGRYVGCSATGDGASRIQMITTLLRKLGCEAAFEPMAEFLDHPDFFVRWHVMRELLGIDALRALPHLKRMAARDPHPETRRVARNVLDRLESPQPRKEAA